MKKSTWIILGLVIVLGLVYFLTKEKQVSVGVKRLKLPVFSSENVDKIEINNKENIKLVKQNDAWMLDIGEKDKPHLVKADQTNVLSMLEAALGVRYSHYVTNLQEKFPELGLTDGVTTIKIFSKDSVIWSLALGKNATGSGRYAKLLDDNDVYVVRGSFYQLTRNGIADWRDREILPVKEDELKAFKLEKAGQPHLALVKDQEGHWKFDSLQKLPKNFRVDANALASLVRAAVHMRAQGFVDEAKALAPPILSMYFTTNGETKVLNFYNEGNEKYLVKRDGDEQLYEVTKYNFDRVNKPIDDLRDFSLLHFDKGSVNKIALMHGKDQIVLNKKDDQWQIVQPSKLPKGFEFDSSAVDDALSLLSGLSGQRLAQDGKDVPQNKAWQKSWFVELSTDDGKKIHLYIGKSRANKGEYLAKGNIDDEIYVVKASRLSSLNSGLDAFKKFELPPMDENTRGFESLPVDVQRKLLDATKKKAHE